MTWSTPRYALIKKCEEMPNDTTWEIDARNETEECECMREQSNLTFRSVNEDNVP